MNIEKIIQATNNIKTLLLSIIRKEKNSSEKKKNVLILKPKVRFSEHSLSVRTPILLTPFNFITVFSLLPFFWGFFDFLNKNEHLRKTLFQKNLPGFDIPTESYNWDTLQYFNKLKKDFLVGIEKIQFSSDSLILTKNLNLEQLNQDYFIASFHKTQKNNDLLNPEKILNREFFGKNRLYLKSLDTESSFVEKSGINKSKFLQFFYSDLDEIPVKMDNLNSYPLGLCFQTTNKDLQVLEKNIPVSSSSKKFFSLSLKEQQNFLNTESNETSNFELDESNWLTNQKNRVKIEILPFDEKLWIENPNNILNSSNNFELLDSTLKLNTIKNIKFVEKELSVHKNSFLETVHKQSSEDLNLEISQFVNGQVPNFKINSFFKNQTSWFLQKAYNWCTNYSLVFPEPEKIGLPIIISDLDEILMEKGFSFFRRMSGYFYPDMNLKQVNNFLVHKVFSNFSNTYSLPTNFIGQTNLKIIFPANSGFINNFSFENQKASIFRIKTGFVNFQDLDKKQSLYSNQALFVNGKNGLDWETLNFNPKTNLKSDLQKLNAQVETRDKVSFGSREKYSPNLRFWLENYFSPLNPLLDSKQMVLKKPVLQQNDFLFSKNDVLVPFLTRNQWQNLYTENKIGVETNLYLNDFKVNECVIPLVQIALPQLSSSRLNFDLTPTLDYVFSSSSSTKTSNYLVPFPTSKELGSLNSFQEHYFSDTESLTNLSYKKLLSIYPQQQSFLASLTQFSLPSEKIFWENWEPLTYRSWLIITQIGFAFVFFNFLKYIITDYFHELIWFIIDIGFEVGLIDQNLKEELEILTGQRDKGFRIVSKTEKKFKNIAGIKTLLPEIAEIVWFLRNKGKDFSLSKNFPRGLLLLGPPGTGKTVLVQALAGEAEVPILKLSGSSLNTPGQSGALKLQILFQEARQLSPCIVFIDEIDSLAQKREGVMQNPMGNDEIFSILEPGNTSVDLSHSTSGDFFKNSEISFFKSRENIEIHFPKESFSKNEVFGPGGKITPTNFKTLGVELLQEKKSQTQEKNKQEQLTLLIQLLIELDGVQSRKGVVVIGATNRPEVLDSAILRQGRFDKILELGLPSHEKRVEIFKLYGQIIGYDPTISWEYLSQRTIGFTAADLASIMNQSSLQAILNDEKNPKHTLQTIEHGIDRITTSDLENPIEKEAPLFLQRIAYYQAGKIVLSELLNYHPPTLVSYLWPRRQNRRSLQILTNLQKYFFQFARRCDLEHRIVGSYGGKAAEILFLEKTPVKISTFGLEDLSFAFVLACFTIEKWYIYSKSTLVAALTQIFSNKNIQQLSPKQIAFYKQVGFSLQLPPHILWSNENELPTPTAQNVFSSDWWHSEIFQELEILQRELADWYRLYLPNPKETEKNIDWSPPDQFYHRNTLIKNLRKKRSISWNNLQTITRDYQIHAFVLESFNKALSLLDENREFLDKLVSELIKRQVLRQSEIQQLNSLFVHVIKSDLSDEGSSDIKIIHNSFGQLSRRKMKNWIDFSDFQDNKKNK